MLSAVFATKDAVDSVHDPLRWPRRYSNVVVSSCSRKTISWHRALSWFMANGLPSDHVTDWRSVSDNRQSRQNTTTNCWSCCQINYFRCIVTSSDSCWKKNANKSRAAKNGQKSIVCSLDGISRRQFRFQSTTRRIVKVGWPHSVDTVQ